jgi:prepilin-type N-terminal cleavage/methylation domain-containing protein
MPDSSLSPSTILSKQSGFTMLELVIVVAIMAIVAGSAIMSFGNTESDAEYQTTNYTLRQLASAVDRYLSDGNTLPELGDEIESPADINFLITKPSISDDWKPDYRLGWRGPYIKGYKLFYVDVGTDLEADGSSSPTSGSLTTVPTLALPDAFSHQPVSPYYLWYKDAAGNIDIDSKIGRPFLILSEDINDLSLYRIVSLGENGTYEHACDYSESNTSHDNYCSRKTLCTSGATLFNPKRDDLVLCFR